MSASVTDSTFEGADLSGADLRRAILVNVDLTLADLSGARTDDVVVTAGLFDQTTCPDGSVTDDAPCSFA